MKIYNTLSGTKEEFVPISGNKVNMYACGMHFTYARSRLAPTASSLFLFSLQLKTISTNYTLLFSATIYL